MASFSNATTADLQVMQAQISESAAEWVRIERKISSAALRKLPVGSGNVFFPDIARRSDALIFHYPEGWKARAYPVKAFTSRKGTPLTFWNIAAVLEGPLTDVYIVEGELDACALVEVGMSADQVLAAPAASGGSYEYVLEALAAGLAKAKRIIWCGDGDSPGLKLRAAMAQLFGIAKFHFVEWPEGSKDANDHLRTDGALAVRELLLFGVMPWPTSGLYRMNELPDPSPMTTWVVFDEWRDKCKLAAGTLSVVTGHPGMGKTTLFGEIWFRVINRYDLVACIASFETRPKPHLLRQLRTLKLGRRVSTLHPDYDGQLLADTDRWINDHYLFMQHPERRPDLGWLLAQAEAAVHRYGVKVVQIDPWNRLEGSREPRESETDYIGRCLRELYNFAVDLDCHVQIIAHPAKGGDGYRRTDPPELDHIHGSKHWDNMVDQGFVVHRPRLFNDDGERNLYTELHHKKSRFEELGYATKFGLQFDEPMGRFGHRELPTTKKSQQQKSQQQKPEGESDDLPFDPPR